MLIGHPLFTGDSEIGQIFKIFKILGTPTELEMPQLKKYENWKDTWPKFKGRGLHAACPNMSDMELDLLTKMIRMDPKKRWNV